MAVKGKAATRRLPPAGDWRTTDADELVRRLLRGESEDFLIERGDEADPYFASWRVSSEQGRRYTVEIRSLSERCNTCSCPDHAVNGLGTCKHVEAVLHRLRGNGESEFKLAAARRSPRIEIFVDTRDQSLRITWPARSRARSRARQVLARFFSSQGVLIGDPVTRVPALRRAASGLAARVRRGIRFSVAIDPWLDRHIRHAAQEQGRRDFESALAGDPTLLDLVGVPLYPYQQEGVLHLAFTERAMLADEMGLGKTVQAIAACVLLHRLRGIQRVLVIAPASLKAEWEEQIAQFTSLDSHIVLGPRAVRLRQYREATFFTLVNYEQVRGDVAAIQELLAPDVVILDEAQRIKNWRTHTANRIKMLRSRYAFVLTGTPLENRIDDVYSITQFLDPQLLGPLFRFNREFYSFDERGRASGYVNLDRLHRRLGAVMLRRRKHEVEGELPGRTVKTCFVAMTDEQIARYRDYEQVVASLVKRAKRRPLSPKEFKRLQQALACMRMICDTPYILDPECRDCPKLAELARLLLELLETEGRKVIVFSEWERMLELVREQLDDHGIGHAWHTGSVPQRRRRDEIRRFKDDPECRVFLSTDAGSVGLNLQVADVVINLDLPWNPARLEQRIARAWRKHQKRSVQVVNLVAEDSIEQRMLATLATKRAVADGAIDGAAESRKVDLPSGRAAMLDRLDQLLTEELEPAAKRGPAAESAATPPSIDKLLGERLVRLERHHRAEGSETMLAVVDRIDDTARQAVARTQASEDAGIELIDAATWAAVQRLIEAGIVQLGPAAELLHGAPSPAAEAAAEAERRQREARLVEARVQLAGAERPRKMAEVLAAGGFYPEALAPLGEAVECAVGALAHGAGEPGESPVPVTIIHGPIAGAFTLPADFAEDMEVLRTRSPDPDEPSARALLATGLRLLDAARHCLEEVGSIQPSG